MLCKPQCLHNWLQTTWRSPWLSLRAKVSVQRILISREQHSLTVQKINVSLKWVCPLDERQRCLCGKYVPQNPQLIRNVCQQWHLIFDSNAKRKTQHNVIPSLHCSVQFGFLRFCPRNFINICDNLLPMICKRRQPEFLAGHLDICHCRCRASCKNRSQKLRTIRTCGFKRAVKNLFPNSFFPGQFNVHFPVEIQPQFFNGNIWGQLYMVHNNLTFLHPTRVAKPVCTEVNMQIQNGTIPPKKMFWSWGRSFWGAVH